MDNKNPSSRMLNAYRQLGGDLNTLNVSVGNKAINKFIKNIKDIPVDTVATTTKKGKISKSASAQLQESMGEIYEGSKKDTLGQSKDRLKDLVTDFSIMADLYGSIRNRLITRRSDELRALGVPASLSYPSTQDMALIDSKLALIKPKLDTYYSARSGNLSEALSMVSTKAGSGPSVTVNIKVDKGVFGAPEIVKGVSSIRLDKRQITNSGVLVQVAATINLDGAIQSKIMAQFPGLNVHDAWIAAAKDAGGLVEAYNKAFQEVTSEYNSVTAHQKTLERFTEGWSSLSEHVGVTLPTVVSAYHEGLISTLSGPAKMEDKKKALEEIQGILEGKDSDEIAEMLLAIQKNFNSKKSLVTKEAGLVNEEKKRSGISSDKVSNINQYTFKDGYTPESTGDSESSNKDKDLGLDDLFHSSTDSPKTNQSSKRRETYDINQQSAGIVFDGLASEGPIRESQEHTETLRDVLRDISEGILTEAKLNVNDTFEETSGQAKVNERVIDLDIQAASNNIPPSGARANGIRMSAQETYVHELVHLVTAKAIHINSTLRSKLHELYSIAQKHIKIEDFMNDPSMTKQNPEYAIEYAAAKRRYDHIFSNTGGTTRGVNEFTGKPEIKNSLKHLHELMALGLTNENFIKALKKLPVNNTVKSEKGFINKLANLWKRAVQLLARWFKGAPTSKNNVQAELLSISRQLVSAAKPKPPGSVSQAVGTVMAKSEKMTNKARKFTHNMLGNKRLEGSKYVLVSGAAKFGKKYLEGGLGELIHYVDDFRSFATNENESFFGEVWSEIIGRRDRNTNLMDQLAYNKSVQDTGRNTIRTGTSKRLLDSFQDLTESQRGSISKVFYKTDIGSLLDFGGKGELLDSQLSRISRLLSNDQSLFGEIDTIEKELVSKYGNTGHYYNNMSDSLGHYMARGKGNRAQTFTNTTAIIANAPVLNEAAKDLLEELATLRAISYTKASHKKDAIDLIAQESAKDVNDNGLVFAITSYKHAMDKAAARIISQDGIKVKGYTKEIFNPHIDFQYDATDSATQKYYEDLGYEAVSTTDNHTLYINRDTANRDFAQGVMSITNSKQKGSTVPTPSAILLNQDNYETANAGKNTDNNPLALTDGDGNIVSYRDTMLESNKDELLDKNNNFDEIVGAMLGNIHDKVSGESQNKDLIKELVDVYDKVSAFKDGGHAKKSFVFISSSSNNPKFVEYYAMIPEATRDNLPVYEIDGRLQKGIYAHKSDLRLIFGQRSMSIQNLFTVPPEHRNHINKFLVALFRGVLGSKAAAKLTKAENVWREIVKMGKDNLIVKGLIITGSNYVSNYVTLLIAGMNPIDAINHQYEAIEQGQKYQKWAAEHYEIGLELEIGKIGGNAGERLRARQTALQSRMTSSPIHSMVKAGGLQTIVEDLPAHSIGDQYSYKTRGLKRLTDTTNKYVGKVNSKVAATGKELLVTQDSDFYTVANNAVQLSDFAARYALNKHLMDQGKSPKEAFRTSMDIFIMYDLPTNKYLQYGNDVGVLWFTKYLLRNQRAFAYMFQNHPFRTLLFSGIDGVTSTDIPSLYDTPLTLDGVDNRFAGPFKILSTFDDPAPVAAGKNILESLSF